MSRTICLGVQLLILFRTEPKGFFFGTSSLPDVRGRLVYMYRLLAAQKPESVSEDSLAGKPFCRSLDQLTKTGSICAEFCGQETWKQT